MSSEEPLATTGEIVANDENQENLSPIEYPIPLNVISKIIDCNFQGSYEEDLVKALAKSTVKFITTIATIANGKANDLKRKTIHAQDVLDAVIEMGFEDIGYELVKFHATYKQEKETQPKQKRRRSNKGKESVDTNPDEEEGEPAITMDLALQIQKRLNELNELKKQIEQAPTSSHESESLQEEEDDDDNDNEVEEEDDDEDDEEDDDDDGDEEDDNGNSVESSNED